jgi:hypothetical protein
MEGHAAGGNAGMAMLMMKACVPEEMEKIRLVTSGEARRAEEYGQWRFRSVVMVPVYRTREL